MSLLNLSTPKGAVFSPDRKYRYALWRIWNPTRRPMMLIGLNPSKADEVVNDPTVTRGEVRASRLGYGGLLMGNIFAYKSTDPDALTGDGDFIGPETDFYLKEMITLSGVVVCGWGAFPAVMSRAGDVLRMIPKPFCLGVTKDGHPKHPLYVSYSTPLTEYYMGNIYEAR